jgi:two-component system NtrC family response regulator
MAMCLLIVDDVPEYLNSLSRALSGAHVIVTAHNLDEAKEKMSESIKLALIDVRLSEENTSNRDGILFLAWLKENYPDVPVIMMSAYQDFEATKNALNLGAAHYLKKPIDLRQLKELIGSLLKD